MKKIVCTRCKKKKPESLKFFYRFKYKKNGLQSHCRECSNKASREWNIKNPERRQRITERHREYFIEYNRQRRKVKGYKTNENKKYNKKYPEKHKAHRIVSYAVKTGKIKRSPCEVCGEKRKNYVHAHHDDYSKPLEVRWLCLKHHKQAHKKK